MTSMLLCDLVIKTVSWLIQFFLIITCQLIHNLTSLYPRQRLLHFHILCLGWLLPTSLSLIKNNKALFLKKINFFSILQEHVRSIQFATRLFSSYQFPRLSEVGWDGRWREGSRQARRKADGLSPLAPITGRLTIIHY